jgi:hypothetical protein
MLARQAFYHMSHSPPHTHSALLVLVIFKAGFPSRVAGMIGVHHQLVELGYLGLFAQG